MSQVPEFSPGCFGSALAFREDIPVCLSCNFREQCKPIHIDNLAKLREHYGIKVAVPRIKRAPVVVSTDESLLRLPKKVRELVERIDRSSIRITENLMKGLNPFETEFPFMRVACHLLLRLDRPINQKLLSAAFMKKMNWLEGTADSHARMAIYILVHVGAVDHIDGQISLRKPNV